MVFLENILNNITHKVHGRPGDINPRVVYYCDIEEEELTLTGDCVIFQSPVRVSRQGVPYTAQQSRSILPLFLIREQLEVEPIETPIKYTCFFLPERLKLNLQEDRLENQGGLVFIHE
jgi:hypothetical protein